MKPTSTQNAHPPRNTRDSVAGGVPCGALKGGITHQVEGGDALVFTLFHLKQPYCQPNGVWLKLKPLKSLDIDIDI